MYIYTYTQWTSFKLSRISIFFAKSNWAYCKLNLLKLQQAISDEKQNPFGQVFSIFIWNTCFIFIVLSTWSAQTVRSKIYINLITFKSRTLQTQLRIIIRRYNNAKLSMQQTWCRMILFRIYSIMTYTFAEI